MLIELLKGEAELVMEIENGKNGMKVLTLELGNFVDWWSEQLNSIPRAVLHCIASSKLGFQLISSFSNHLLYCVRSLPH